MRATLYDPKQGKLLEGGVELVDEWERCPESLLWLMIEADDPQAEEALLSSRFKIHRLAVTDAMRDRHPPKIESFEDYTFMLLKGLDATSSTSLRFTTIQLSLFVGDRFLVSRGSRRSVSSEALLKELLNGEIEPDLPRAVLAFRLCRKVFDRFLPILLQLEERLDSMEEDLLRHPSDDLLGQLVRQKSDLKRMLRVLQFHRQIFDYHRADAPHHLAGHKHEKRDVEEQIDRHLSLARLYFELSDDLMNGYLSLSSHRLNQIMQTLTIVTVIFVPITFMAGVYGMNFENMPELGVRNAYFVLLGLMGLVVTGILSFFFWRGWLGGGHRLKGLAESEDASGDA